MRLRRTLLIVLVVLLIAAVLTVVVLLRGKAPPEPARLLPGADAFVYLNLRRMRWASVFGDMKPVSHAPEYEQFIQETGIQFERDLDQAALAVHYPAPSPGAAPGAGKTARVTWVFEGTMNAQRLAAYLGKIARSKETYRDLDIFSVPLEDHIARVAILSVDTVALSDSDDPEVIRGIVDRSRKRASPFAGPAFLRAHYKDVPFASLAWAIVRVHPASTNRLLGALGGLESLFPREAVVVASIRLLRALHLRAEVFTASEDDARQVTGQVATFLALFHAAEISTPLGGPDPDAKAFFSSLKVEQDKDRAVLTAIMPLGFVRKALRDPVALAPPEPAKEKPAISPEPLLPKDGKTTKTAPGEKGRM
jgi:hypothetical protein